MCIRDRVYPAPFAVNLDAADNDWVEPDISVICDHRKLTDRGCSGAPDLMIEVVSPSSSRMDYIIKLNLYMAAGEMCIRDRVKKGYKKYTYAGAGMCGIISLRLEIIPAIWPA